MPAFAQRQPERPQKKAERRQSLIVVEEVPEAGDDHREADEACHGLARRNFTLPVQWSHGYAAKTLV